LCRTTINYMMKRTSGYLLLFFVFCFRESFAIADDVNDNLQLSAGFMAEVTPSGGGELLYYELCLSNLTADTLVLARLDVFDSTNNRIVLSLSGETLAGRFNHTGKKMMSNGTILQPGDTAIIYLELWAQRLAGTTLSHRVQYRKRADSFDIKGASCIIPAASAVCLGQPLEGGPWVAIYEPSWAQGHRRVRYTVNGSTGIPGRYAIDFMLLDNLGHFVKGDEDKIANWFGYNARVLAVANGVVVGIREDFPESTTLTAHPAYPAEQATGNYICLRIAEHKYVFYEHLKPGTIKVSKGQRVKKGQVLAKVGFTGQTTGPHLHLHMADTPSPLGAEGLPFAFETFQLSGSYPDFSTFGKNGWMANEEPQNIHVNERPAPNTVIRFPEQ
jgi:murein DD-endopeptidase